MLGQPLIIESHDQTHGSFYQFEKLLCRVQSDYQEIMVVQTQDHGRIMFIDGQIMFTSTTQAPYNESMAQIPIHLHAQPERALIVGGGDGWVLRSVLQHPSIEKVVLAELDGEVVNVAREYFPSLCESFDDPRVTIRIGDGAKYVRETKDAFDVCIIDSTDPYLWGDEGAVATPLAQPEFYRGLQRLLGDSGVGIQILGHHYFYESVFKLLYKRLQELWRSVDLAMVPVPFYISGCWALGVFSQAQLDCRNPRRCELAECDYYNTAVHKAAFAHPNDVRRILESL